MIGLTTKHAVCYNTVFVSFVDPFCFMFVCHTVLSLGSPARMGWPLGSLVFEVFLVFFCNFPILCSESGVALDCIDS